MAERRYIKIAVMMVLMLLGALGPQSGLIGGSGSPQDGFSLDLPDAWEYIHREGLVEYRQLPYVNYPQLQDANDGKELRLKLAQQGFEFPFVLVPGDRRDNASLDQLSNLKPPDSWLDLNPPGASRFHWRPFDMARKPG